MEERGIGRPSTYAPTIEVVQERAYVRQEDRRLHPTELGKTVDGLLREHFPEVVDVDFTADLERRLDAIETGKRKFETTVREWYTPFSKTVEKAQTDDAAGQGSGQVHRRDLPGVRHRRAGGPRGPVRPVRRLLAVPRVRLHQGQEAVVRRAHRRELPALRQAAGAARRQARPLRRVQRIPEVPLPPRPRANAGGGIRPPRARAEAEPRTSVSALSAGNRWPDRRSRRGSFVGCSGYPDCRYIQPRAAGAGAAPAPAAEPTGESCPDCGKPLVRRQGRFGPFVSCSGYPGCTYRPPRKRAAGAAEVAS